MITQSWPIDDLKQNPDQAIFDDLDDHTLAELVESIREVGLREPIVITRNGTIVCGHQRARACKILGWTEILAYVVDGDGRREFAESNLNRHQLGPLAVARVVKYLLDVETEENPKARFTDGELRRRVAEALGKSVRHANRYIRLLQLPLPIQHAIDRELTQACGQKICKLSPKKQQAIADEIAAGGDPVEIAKKYLPSPKAACQEPDVHVQAADLVFVLSELLENPRGIINALAPRADNLDAIKKAMPLLVKAQSALEQRMIENQERLEDALDELSSLAG